MAIRQQNNVTLLGSLTFTDTSLTTSKEGVAVTQDTSNSWGVKIATAGNTVIGVIPDQVLYQNGDPIHLAGVEGQIVDCLAGAAGFAIGDPVKATTSGAVITAGATDNFFGIALEAATSGNLGAVLFKSGGSIASVVNWTRSTTTNYPTTSGDTIATGPRGTDAAVIELSSAGGLVTNGTGANPNLAITCKGTGVPTFTNSNETATVFVRAIAAPTQGTTGTGGTVGRITVANMTANAVIIATCAESPGAVALAYVVAGVGYFTCYDNTNTAISGKKINYFVVSL